MQGTTLLLLCVLSAITSASYICSGQTTGHSPPIPRTGDGHNRTNVRDLHGKIKDPAEHQERSAGVVTIQVDGASRHQIINGFGATLTVFENGGVYKRHDHNQPERVTASEADRKGIARILYKEVGLTRARVVLGGFEPRNDNDDPFLLNAAGFDWRIPDAEMNFVALARPLGLRTWWASSGLEDERDAWRRKPGSPCALDPAKIDEEVEWLLAAALRFRDRQMELEYLAVLNEPDLCPSGHGPGRKIELADLVTIVKRLGKRLRDNGLRTKIVVSDGWLPQNALHYMQAVLDDPQARQFVGALAFHSYDGYDDPGLLLSTSARSAPPHQSVAVREKIRDLAERNNLPVWMTEVCYCSPRDFSDFDLIRARLNHVHDELTITDASAFDVMNLFFIDRPRVRDELVHTYFRPDGTLERYEISTYGYLLSHYSRFIPTGSVRLKAESGDATVRVTAFERPDGSPVIVVLNNSSSPIQANFALSGLSRIPRVLATLTSQEGALLQRARDAAIQQVLELKKSGRKSKTYQTPSDPDIATVNATAVLPPLSITTFFVPDLADGLKGPDSRSHQPMLKPASSAGRLKAGDPHSHKAHD